MAARAVLQQVLWQVFGRNIQSADHHYQPLDHIFELPHISRPRIFFQDFQDFRLHRLKRLLGRRTIIPQEMIHEQCQVAISLTQGRHRDRHHVDTVIQVLTKLPLADQIFEVIIRGAD